MYTLEMTDSNFNLQFHIANEKINNLMKKSLVIHEEWKTKGIITVKRVCIPDTDFS